MNNRIKLTLDVTKMDKDDMYRIDPEDNPHCEFYVSREKGFDSKAFIDFKLNEEDYLEHITKPKVYWIEPSTESEVNMLIVKLFNKLGYNFLCAVNSSIRDGSGIYPAVIAAWEEDLSSNNKKMLYTNIPGPSHASYASYDIREININELIYMVEQRHESQ
jgi:hypothetical protein